MEWKDIKDYYGLYQVNDTGDVKSLKYGKEKILKPLKNKWGYFEVALSKDGKKKWISIHRLVATTFIHNPYNLPCVNHKDEDKTNNRVDNLEWCSYGYNNNYGTHIKKIVEKRSKKVLQFSKTGKLVREWSSPNECGRNGFSVGDISLCCRGERKSHKGFIWKYKE